MSEHLARAHHLSKTWQKRSSTSESRWLDFQRSARPTGVLAREQQLGVRFVSTLAHELRQPLSTLLTALEMVRVAPDRATAIMKRQICQMDRLVEDLMDTARWSCGKVTVHTQRLDVREIVTDAARDVAESVAGRGQELVVAVGAAPLWADVDRQRLQQVLSNLLGNAMKYTDPGGRIQVSADQAGATVILRVSDTGRGIAREALTHIFDLFSQVMPSEGGGLGVGLSVVREIVTLHHGRIDAKSEGPGRGSEFVVTLPATAAPTARTTNCVRGTQGTTQVTGHRERSPAAATLWTAERPTAER